MTAHSEEAEMTVELHAVLERLCRLSGEVRTALNGAADCFCGNNLLALGERASYGIFEYDEDVLAFIEHAVRAALLEHHVRV